MFAQKREAVSRVIDDRFIVFEILLIELFDKIKIESIFESLDHLLIFKFALHMLMLGQFTLFPDVFIVDAFEIVYVVIGFAESALFEVYPQK